MYADMLYANEPERAERKLEESYLDRAARKQRDDGRQVEISRGSAFFRHVKRNCLYRQIYIHSPPLEDDALNGNLWGDLPGFERLLLWKKIRFLIYSCNSPILEESGTKLQMMGDKWGSAELPLPPSDCGGGSWQERAPSPDIDMPISFTQENSIRPPSSPLHFLDYFDDHTGCDEVLNSEWLHSGGDWDWTISFSQDTESASHLPQPIQGYTEGSIMQPNDLPSSPHLGSSIFNRLSDTPSSSQTPLDVGYPLQPNELVSHHQHLAQNHGAPQKNLSKDQRYRLRLKAKEQAKDYHIKMLNQHILRMNGEVARLRSENEMLRKNKDEQVTRLVEQIKMLIKEIKSIKHNNLLIH
ncbi:hypothetical protein V6N13_023920 [Hibiscus sabdariffa]|uniref:BZIP domain-containing protein n=1 Tax=Hibiscus sabdariffa TaxID=183260 RepID=A0ABR1Z6M4_9ROSI